VQPQEYFYAPDPSSQSVCSIGGNVAENSGGAHCLKYGFTTTHVLGLEVVLSDGSLVHLGGKTLDAPGYDLAGVFVGSEGTLGVATKVILRIVKRPECVRTLLAAFPSTNEAGAAVSGIIAAGMLPAAIEMMDSLAIQAAEAAVHANYPDCGGLLLVELDGPAAEVAALMTQVRGICTPCGAWGLRVAQAEQGRAAVWKGRKAAFAALGRIPTPASGCAALSLPSGCRIPPRCSRGPACARKSRAPTSRIRSRRRGSRSSSDAWPGARRRARQRGRRGDAVAGREPRRSGSDSPGWRDEARLGPAAATCRPHALHGAARPSAGACLGRHDGDGRGWLHGRAAAALPGRARAAARVRAPLAR